MNPLTLYFGPRMTTVMQTKGKKIVHYFQIPFSSIASEELEEKVPREEKLLSVIEEELKKKRISSKNAIICLPGNDLIVRTFEIPPLPRQELQGAINFEVKKYMPFKIEDLVSDFQLMFDKVAKTDLVLFAGIRKETRERYFSVLKQLNIRRASIEYSAFSLLRCLPLTHTNTKGIVGILGVDLKERDEINFIVLENGFPLFCRDINIGIEPEEAFVPAAGTEGSSSLEKFKTEIRISLDYYHRKFPGKEIKNLFLITSLEYRQDLESFFQELGLGIKFIDLSEYTGAAIPYSLSFIKAYSASLSGAIKSNIKIDLARVKEGLKLPEPEKERPKPLEAVSFLEYLKLDRKILIGGLIICLLTFAFGSYHIIPLQRELQRVKKMRVPVYGVDPQASYDILTSKDTEEKDKLKTLEGVVKEHLYLTELLNILPRAVPKGVWFKHIAFHAGWQNEVDLSISGMAYLGNTDEEFTAINTLLGNLKEKEEFSRHFKEIALTTIDRSQVNGLNVSTFVIYCKGY